MANDAWNRLAEEEANGLAALLEGKGRKLLVLVVAVEHDTVTLCGGVSEGTTGGDAKAFVQALDRERDHIASSLIRKST